ncbi:hypothetical protein [Erwinia sp.]|uniref:hypothetical protein n=1 Tax=Erwinia citreus TaxID=558 RepID=UPI0028A0DE63|nr:hypothetical protein [Erwinia sp.]
MRLLKDAELFYVSGGNETTPDGPNHTDTTLMTVMAGKAAAWARRQETRCTI